jgi:outer membrane protein assembly factor BamB
VPSPLVVGDGLMFLCSGYGKGSMMLKLNNSGGKISPEPVFTLKTKVFGSEQQTPLFYGGYIYGVRIDSQMVCMDIDGNTVWTSTSQKKFKKGGPYMIADGLMYIMNGSGKLTMAEATPDGYVQLDEAKVLDGIESWAPMAMVSGRLIVRDLKRMICLDVSEQ